MIEDVGVARCRECGCTEDNPCHLPISADACYWVEADLCSQCAMPKVVLVGCASQKLPQAAIAGELYDSALFRAAARWAKRYASEWFVLSAQHGLLPWFRRIQPYDLALRSLSHTERSAWVCRVWEQMDAAGLLGGDKRLIWLAGKEYVDQLWTRCEDEGLLQEAPLRGMGIGQRIRWLRTNTTDRPIPTGYERTRDWCSCWDRGLSPACNDCREQFLVGSAGSFILCCPRCGEEHFAGIPHAECCFTCSDSLCEPVLRRELDSRWRPLWRCLSAARSQEVAL